MAVKIKLARLGKIRQPYYRIIVADARTRRGGKVIETIGKYHPKDEPSLIQVNSERAQYWLGVGAQPTQPVRRLLEVTGDWQKYHGLPGAEGMLKQAEPKKTKAELFAEALAAAGEEPVTEATTPKRKGSGRPDRTDAGKTESPDKADAGKADSSGSNGAAAEKAE